MREYLENSNHNIQNFFRDPYLHTRLNFYYELGFKDSKNDLKFTTKENNYNNKTCFYR